MADVMSVIALIIDGYIRRIQPLLSKDKIIPYSINEICLKYYDPYTEYDGKFIKENITTNMKIINDYEIVSNEDFESAKLDTPINIGVIAIYCCHIIIECNQTQLGPCDFFGVVSDECTNIGHAPCGGLIDFYGISGVAPDISKGTNYGFMEDENYKTDIMSKQIVTIEIDCISSKITFKSNEKVIYGPFVLPKKRCWYPTVSFALSDYNYRCKLIKHL